MAQAPTPHHDTLRDYSPVLALSVAAHLVLLALLTLNLDLMPRKKPEPARLAIQATVVDSRALQQRALQEERRARQARETAERRRREEAERVRREEQRQVQADEKRKADEVEAQRQAEALAKQKAAAEAKRKADAEAKQKADAKRKADAQAQRKAEAEAKRKAAAEARRKAEAEAKQKADAKLKAEALAKRKAEAERREAQSRADLARQLAEEEHLDAAQGSGLLAQYVDVIRQKVERNWLKPASARSGIHCVVQVQQIPGGEVVDVRVTECNGDAAVVRSIEAAVLRSSPLPPPPDPALFERSLEFVFQPAD